MTEEQEVTDKIKTMNAEYRELTGNDAYLYAYSPEERANRYVFATSQYHFRKVRAVLHMETVLDLARRGRTHEEIMYGTKRAD